jgi:hypothetical protein
MLPRQADRYERIEKEAAEHTERHRLVLPVILVEPTAFNS